MATDTTKAAQVGYERERANPHLNSSPNWMAYEAGQAMANAGYTKPTKATMGRGYSVNIETAANRFHVTFDRHMEPHIERLGE